MRARALVVVVLLVSYGAVGARQPAVRVAVPLPAPAQTIADALDLPSVDRSRFVLDIVRTAFAIGVPDGDTRQRANLRAAIGAAGSVAGESVPLPLDPSIWRESILERPTPDHNIMAAILSDRSTALLYHGLAGLDDETLAWLGPERDTLRHLLRRAGAFAVFGPSVRVHAGRVVVPGGTENDALWQAVVGADPARPAAFVRRLFGDDSGALAWFYDTMANLDEPRFRFATSAWLSGETRIERVKAVLDIFARSATDWIPEKQPFSRRPLDPALTLMVIGVTADGALAGPADRGLWDRVFSNDSTASPRSRMREVATSDPTPIDAPWLLSRLHRVTMDIGRRRLETFLFAQRVFDTSLANDPQLASVLRAQATFPSLLLTLERMGIRSVRTMSTAAARASALADIGDDQTRTLSMTWFQASLGLLDRIARSGTLSPTEAEALVTRLAVVDSSKGYAARVALWLQRDLLAKLPEADGESGHQFEDTLLAAMAGRSVDAGERQIEWEGRRYRVDGSRAEERRLHRVREKQGGVPLDAALERAQSPQKSGGERVFADTLTSLLYAAYLGDPQGPALGGSNVALRHDLGASGVMGLRAPWRLPTEGHTSKGWRVSGSLLGLDVALARLSLRRLDAGVMPPEPRLVSAERHTAAVTVSLVNPRALTDAGRDEIAAALARGRARLEALDPSQSDIGEFARDAGLSPWRREALRWTVEHDSAGRRNSLSLVELMWLGRPRSTDRIALDGWGATVLPLTGCVCLAMPAAGPWETLGGRPSMGLLASRGADVSILVAETLASLDIPARVAPGVIAYAMQDVIDQAQPVHFDDWSGFSHAASRISRNTLVDYIAAQTAGGPLVPATTSDNRQP